MRCQVSGIRFWIADFKVIKKKSKSRLKNSGIKGLKKESLIYAFNS
jgi:hypothetical protein